jgi:putative heme iron utilization protein
MTFPYAQQLRELLQGQPVASLGTLHKGQPFVSMVPFALLPSGKGMVIHVSKLASHTKDMISSPQLSLMVMAPPDSERPPQAWARVTFQGEAVPFQESDSGYDEAKAAYLSRFPHSIEMFDFADFSLFAIIPHSIRFVGGFGMATTLTPEVFAAIFQ